MKDQNGQNVFGVSVGLTDIDIEISKKSGSSFSGGDKSFDPYAAMDAAESSDVVMVTEKMATKLEEKPAPIAAADKKPEEKPAPIAAAQKKPEEKTAPITIDPELLLQMDRELHRNSKKKKSWTPLIVMMAIFLAFIFIATPLLFSQAPKTNKRKEQKQQAVEPTNTIPSDPYEAIAGVWKSKTDNSCFAFLNSKEFYYLNNCDDVSNYYHGTLTFEHALKAIAAFDITKKDGLGLFGLDDEDVSDEAFYAIKLKVDGENDNTKLLLVLTSDHTAYDYRYDTDKTCELVLDRDIDQNNFLKNTAQK